MDLSACAWRIWFDCVPIFHDTRIVKLLSLIDIDYPFDLGVKIAACYYRLKRRAEGAIH